MLMSKPHSWPTELNLLGWIWAVVLSESSWVILKDLVAEICCCKPPGNRGKCRWLRKRWDTCQYLWAILAILLHRGTWQLVGVWGKWKYALNVSRLPDICPCTAYVFPPMMRKCEPEHWESCLCLTLPHMSQKNIGSSCVWKELCKTQRCARPEAASAATANIAFTISGPVRDKAEEFF